MGDLVQLAHLICRAAVYGALAIAVVEGVRYGLEHRSRSARLAACGLGLFIIGLGLRALAPWGPHVSSGRDVPFIDAAIQGVFNERTALLSSLYPWLAWLGDPLQGLVWGQLAIGALNCSLVALLTWQLVRSPVAAWFAGLLAAGMVVLIRVDAGPGILPELRLFLLLALVLAARWRSTRSALALSGTVLACVALSYARLESPLLAGLVLTWLLVDPAGDRVDAPAEEGAAGRGYWLLGVCLGLGMFGVLVDRIFLVPLVVAVALILIRRRGWALLDWPLVAAVGLTALLLVPRALEISQLGRETASRFPVSFMYLFGRLNILLADPWLCTPFVLLLLIVGLYLGRRRFVDLHRYLACVAWPLFVLYLLFMGDTSARLKLQGTGIMLLLPACGLGGGLIVGRLTAWRLRPWAWALGLTGAMALLTAPLAGRSLPVRTTLQQEFAYWQWLAGRVPRGTRVYAPADEEAKNLVNMPAVLQRRAGIEVIQIGPEQPLPKEPGAVVYLGIGCRQFHDGKVLPGVGYTLSDEVIDHGWPSVDLLLRFTWDKHTTLNEFFDGLEVGQWDRCQRFMAGLDLEPWLVWQARRSPYEGRFMPKGPFPFGLFRARAR